MFIGETVYVDGEPVENVLISNSGFFKGVRVRSEIDDEVGPVSDFTLYFPSSFDGDLLHKKLTIRGIECDVENAPAHEEPERVFQSWVTSTGFGVWDMVVYANRTRPEYAETIAVYCKRYTRDSLGDRTLAEIVALYTGAAQVRFNKADEATIQAATQSRAEYYFVTPHIAGIDSLPTQCLTVEYKGEVYDVQSVENIDEKDAKTSMRATLRDHASDDYVISPTVAPEDAASVLFDTPVSDIQEGVVVSDKRITGTLKYLTEGSLPAYWGAGYFLALKFGTTPSNVKVLVGLDPTAGSGLAELDADRNGVWKITNKDSQKFAVVSSSGTRTEMKSFDLSGLVLEPEASNG